VLSMVRLYLDLETYRPKKEGSFVEERIISSGLLIDETPYQEDSLKESIQKNPLCIRDNYWVCLRKNEWV